MPYLKIQTNAEISPAHKHRLLSQASALLAQELGKPEEYVMVRIDPSEAMLFAKQEGPCAYLELKSIGLRQHRNGALSKALCDMLHREIKVPAERIYIEFTDAHGPMWGWNGSTF